MDLIKQLFMFGTFMFITSSIKFLNKKVNVTFIIKTIQRQYYNKTYQNSDLKNKKIQKKFVINYYLKMMYDSCQNFLTTKYENSTEIFYTKQKFCHAVELL